MQYLMTRQIQALLDNGNISIENFSPTLLEKDHYRFRAYEFKHNGQIYDSITLNPHEYVLCLSYERFKTSGIVIGDISQISDNALAGLVLNKSDYVDRRFKGRLRLGLYNMSSSPIQLSRGSVVGKVYFYKVCDIDWCGCFDTQIDPQAPKTLLEKRFEHRANSDEFESPILGAGKQWY